MEVVDIVLASGVVVLGLAVVFLAYQLRIMYWRQTFLVPLHPPLPLRPTPTIEPSEEEAHPRSQYWLCGWASSSAAVWPCDVCGRGFPSVRA